MPRHLLNVLAAALSLAACAQAPMRAEGLPLPPLAAFAVLEVPAAQALEIAFGSREESLQCALASDAKRWQSICVNPLGFRVFTLGLDAAGNITAERGPGVPEALDPRRVLADVQLAAWPLPALEAAYSDSGWQVTQAAPDTRRQWFEGALVAEVHYAGAGPKGRHWLVNLQQGYSLGIAPLAP